eukprot:m.164803 g.164803  ORF g.164803 m.164803 type:complete len:219 (-) comp14410_c0_seq2:1719-2375(-)
MWKVLRRSRSLFRVARSISSAPQRPTRLPARPSRQPIADHPSQVTRAIQVLTLLHLTRTMATAPTVQLSPEEWKAKLTKEEYHVLREKGTERAGSGEYDKFYPKKDEGYFACRGCGEPLYSAEAKFNSGCGWPAFDKCYTGAVKTNVDTSFGMRRVEIVCAACDGHLGHVFEGEHMTPTNERHCVNSVSVKFVKGALDKPESKVGPVGVGGPSICTIQ